MKRMHVNVGTTVELYPLTAWTRLPSGVSLEALWQLCGPQVERHLSILPLWKVFALVYFEGLAHGSGAERKRLAAESVRSAPLVDAGSAGR